MPLTIDIDDVMTDYIKNSVQEEIDDYLRHHFSEFIDEYMDPYLEGFWENLTTGIIEHLKAKDSELIKKIKLENKL